MKNCLKCGEEIAENSLFCTFCGAKQVVEESEETVVSETIEEVAESSVQEETTETTETEEVDKSVEKQAVSAEKTLEQTIVQPTLEQQPTVSATSTISQESKLPKWNWGAAGLGWIWGVGNNVPIMLLGLLPFGNIVMMIVGGIKGYEWLLERNKHKYSTVDEMLKDQKTWNTMGIVFFVLNVLYLIFIIVLVFIYIAIIIAVIREGNFNDYDYNGFDDY
ncbi:hypothetical protein SAMN02745116_02068 [Pilibacter termitis]|uniref:Zinc-ribbon domain-containing protein n=1 Tax=Pilibacter termitis TaxID=263852 RepID=A0A1T4Q5W5_9ENTE|nr:zinc ribbon domain-containing protein [Pilibacter termitis]SJZ99152.1 hypothetical protein SAMN02745116_02068 [Pilibacter termitis]